MPTFSKSLVIRLLLVPFLLLAPGGPLPFPLVGRDEVGVGLELDGLDDFDDFDDFDEFNESTWKASNCFKNQNSERRSNVVVKL